MITIIKESKRLMPKLGDTVKYLNRYTRRIRQGKVNHISRHIEHFIEYATKRHIHQSSYVVYIDRGNNKVDQVPMTNIIQIN